MKAGRGRGIALALAGSVLWGASGIAGQILLQDRGVTPEWLSAARMIGAGLLLLLMDGAQHGRELFAAGGNGARRPCWCASPCWAWWACSTPISRPSP